MRLRLRSSDKGNKDKADALEVKGEGEDIQAQEPESPESSEGEEVQEKGRRDPERIKKTLLLILRDVVFAVIIVVIILVAIIAYTRVWPPMVVIESSSMQHRYDVSYIGVIDTGDLVLVQAAPQRSDVITWVEGKARGYMTYSNHGDVIIFNTGDGGTPIIHRPIIWLEYNSTTNKFDAPDLEQLNRSLWSGTYANSTPVDRPYGLDHQLYLTQVGWKGDIMLSIDVGDFLGDGVNYSGYVTLGDNNQANYDRTLVRQENIIGKARGELPWLGLIKLTISPSAGKCCRGWGDSSAPKNSWDALIVSLVLMFTLPIVLDITGVLISRLIKRRNERREEIKEGKEDSTGEGEKEQGSQDKTTSGKVKEQGPQEDNNGQDQNS